MKNMDKGLNVPKWVLINWPKIPQIPQNLYIQVVCSSYKVLVFNEKRLQWASVVRVFSLTAEWVVAHYVCNIASSDEAFVLGMRVSQT